MTLRIFDGRYTHKLMISHPRETFLFGDNLERRGNAGLAIIRGYPNALGVATKIAPSTERSAYFYDQWLDRHLRLVLLDLYQVEEQAKHYDIIVPVTSSGRISLGLGLANLEIKSPTTYKVITSYLNNLAEDYGGWESL